MLTWSSSQLLKVKWPNDLSRGRAQSAETAHGSKEEHKKCWTWPSPSEDDFLHGIWRIHGANPKIENIIWKIKFGAFFI